MYTKYAESQGWRCEIIDANEPELGGFKEVIFSVDGENVYSKMKFESGVHRLQRVPATETQGRGTYIYRYSSGIARNGRC